MKTRYQETPETRMAGLERDVRNLKRRQQVPKNHPYPGDGSATDDDPGAVIDSTENVGDTWGVHSAGPETEGWVLTADGTGGSTWAAVPGGGGGGGVVLKSELLTASDLAGLGSFGSSFSFSHSLGDALVSFADPTQPAVLADGVYIFTAVITVTSAGPSAPTPVTLAVGLGSSYVATSQGNLVVISGGVPTVGLSAAKNLSAGNKLRVGVAPGDLTASYSISHPVITFIGAS
jgi:hypothetical protein